MATPARRAFDRPMAMACLALRAPCSPSRMWWISSRTNSPAWVLADAPRRLARRARSTVAFSGIRTSFRRFDLPAAETLPDLDGLAVAKHLVLGMLRGRGAGVVRQDAHERAHRVALEVDRTPAAAGDDPVLLVGIHDDEVLDRVAVRVADQPIALVHALLRGAAVARERHPARVHQDPALFLLVADHGREHGDGDVVDAAD